MEKIVILEDFPLLEDKVDKLIKFHAKNGFAIVSACRHDKTAKENLDKTEELKNTLKNMGWGYTVAYGGGFKEMGEKHTEKSEHKFNEISFVVYNHNRKDTERDFLKDMIFLCGKFDQDDIYYQEPDGKAYWYNREGKKDATFNGMTKNDNDQDFFTGFGKARLSNKDKEKFLKGKVGSEKAFENRFSGIMEGVNPPAATRIEEIKRHNDGEIFLSTYNVLTSSEVYEILNSETGTYFNY